MNWRTWLYQTLKSNAALALLLPQSSIFGSGSLVTPPKARPFLIIHMDKYDPGPFPGVSRGRATLWAHDEPGDYLRIDAMLSAARAAIVGPDGRLGSVVQVGAIGALWQGDSPDFSDQDLGTILRTSTYDLLGKDGND